MHLNSTALMKAYSVVILFVTVLNRMDMVKEQIGQLQMVLLPCSMRLTCLCHFGMKQLQRLFMHGICAPLQKILILHHILNGTRRNLILVIYVFGDVWHMCTSRRIRELVSVLIWRNASSSDILQDIRVGNSIILSPRR